MAVEDDGPGIPNDLRERVFDKFFRATRNGDVTRQPSGTGMGLAIAKGIVEAHEGRIWIESGEGGKGTRVVFTSYESMTNQPRILVVDDEPQLTRVLRLD